MPSTTLIRSIAYCGLYGCIIAGIVVAWAYSQAGM
jgi:hypothetical protein